MKRIVACALLGVAALARAPAQEPGPDGVRWGRDLAAAEESAARSGKPLLLVFRCER